MNSRERVLAALARRPVDRTPVDFCGHNDSTIAASAYRRLRAHLGLPPDCPERASLYQGTVYAAEDVLARFGVDCRAVHLPVPDDVGEQLADGSHLLAGEDGSLWKRPAGGLYYDLWRPALVGELTSAAIAAMPWPMPSPAELDALAERARRLHTQTDYAIVLAGFLIMPVTGVQIWRGFEQWSIDALTEPARWQEMTEAYLERAFRQADAILKAVEPWIDVVYIIGDDLATQQGPWVSPDFYRRHIKPWHRRAMEFIRARTAARIVFHMCGAARAFIPDLIDLGVDAINPVQMTAAGMEPRALKRDFGQEIAFWGGVDTQRVLPFGAPADVAREVQRCHEALGPTGYILASCHNVQADVPPANLEAMFKAAVEG